LDGACGGKVPKINEDAGHQPLGLMMPRAYPNVKGTLHSPGEHAHDTVTWWTRLQLIQFSIGNYQLAIVNLQ
jgi:hypothetical protein